MSLAASASAEGAIVVFEPSARSDDKLFAEAIGIAHIVKYADQRLAAVGGAMVGDSAALLEVQTLGAEGLRYRHRLSRTPSDWMYLPAVPAPRLADTCGAGDWCTAGILAKAAMGGQVGFRSGGVAAIGSALRYGQALAAWNCAFEGARGGMYAVGREAFEKQVQALASGRRIVLAEAAEANHTMEHTCPACPLDGLRSDSSEASSSRGAYQRASAA